MPVVPVDPSFLTSGAEWSIGISGSEGKVDPSAPGASGGSGFGDMLKSQIQGLSELQADAAAQSTALATGQATDPTAVVMAVERARMGMQLATQIRSKSVEAFQEVFRTQV